MNPVHACSVASGSRSDSVRTIKARSSVETCQLVLSCQSWRTDGVEARALGDLRATPPVVQPTPRPIGAEVANT